jgi:hypothetical protein
MLLLYAAAAPLSVEALQAVNGLSFRRLKAQD